VGTAIRKGAGAGRFIAAYIAALSLFAFANCQAEEANKQSAASRLSSKARDHAQRQGQEGPPSVAAAATTGAAGQAEGDKMPVVDSQVVDKAARDTGDNWKKMDKILDRF